MTGIIPPLVTPLLDNDKLDIDGLERLIERLIKGGVHGLFILGTTGEAQSISYRLRHEMIKETCRINALKTSGSGLYFRYFNCRKYSSGTCRGRVWCF